MSARPTVDEEIAVLEYDLVVFRRTPELAHLIPIWEAKVKALEGAHDATEAEHGDD